MNEKKDFYGFPNVEQRAYYWSGIKLLNGMITGKTVTQELVDCNGNLTSTIKQDILVRVAGEGSVKSRYENYIGKDGKPRFFASAQDATDSRYPEQKAERDARMKMQELAERNERMGAELKPYRELPDVNTLLDGERQPKLSSRGNVLVDQGDEEGPDVENRIPDGAGHE